MEKIKNFLTETYWFLTSKIFFMNLLKLVGGALLLGFMLMFGLKCYTNHGESRQVPDLTGLTLKDAQKLARSKGLQLVVSDSLFKPDKKPNVVLDQTPKPLSRVKQNRNIYLSITKSSALMTEFPQYRTGESLWGKDYNDVRRSLRAKNIDVRVVARVFNEAENTVLEFIYAGDTLTERVKRLEKIEVPEYSTIDVVVAEAGTDKVDIPKLVCQSLGEAQFILSGLNVNLGSVIESPGITDRQNAYVWKQFPPYEPGRKIKMGEQVDIYIMQGRPQGCSDDELDGGGETGINELPDMVAPKPKPAAPKPAAPKPKPKPQPETDASDDGFFDE
jgi:beta-lactam-binding protein with PASTA domain